MYGGTSVTYTPPPPDTSFKDFLNWQMEEKKRLDTKADQDKRDEQNRQMDRRNAGLIAYPQLKETVQQQVKQGLISFAEGTNQLRDYAAKYDLTPPEGDIQALTQQYTADLPGKRATGVQAAFEELLGRSATQEEINKAQERFQSGYYGSFQDLRDSLSKSPEYQEKFNRSYLENYYDTKFGKQTLDAEGKRTGQRTFKFASNLLPSYAGDLKAKTNITIPDFGESFTGTPAEIEEQVQNIRETRQFLYSSGLTALQGTIDKEVQSLKNEGTKDITKISSKGSVYSNLVSGFWG